MNDLQKQLIYWQETSDRDLKTAEGLFKLKRYDACLFFCHLSLEKFLKGLVVAEIHGPAPYIHNLKKLAKLANLDLTDEDMANLIVITDFNISGRYPEIKSGFYTKCDKTYTEKYLTITKSLHSWLKRRYPNN